MTEAKAVETRTGTLSLSLLSISLQIFLFLKHEVPDWSDNYPTLITRHTEDESARRGRETHTLEDHTGRKKSRN
jgi:hypothetical protein